MRQQIILCASCVLALSFAAGVSSAAEPLDLSSPAVNAPASSPPTNNQPAPAGTTASGGLEAAIEDYFNNWSTRVAYARSTQPGWSSPLVTTTALLEQRYRFDAQVQSIGNGSSTTNFGGGKGLDLIVGDTQEIQFGDDPYVIHQTPNGKQQYNGFADWPVFRFKQRLASSPESQGNYVVSAWLQIQVPVGIPQVTNHALTLLPTLGFGKGWGPIVVQGTAGLVIPTSNESKYGTQFVGNAALQYRVLNILWPQMEVNWTYWADGQRGGLNQVFLTPGIVIGRVSLTDRLKATVGFGYQWAVSPNYRPSPLTPTYNHAWLTTARLSF